MKKYINVRKLTDSAFLNLYEMDAIDTKGEGFHYYFATRNSEDKLRLKTHNMEPEGVLVYALCKDNPDKLLMIKQYRYPVDEYLYELPAGLIDEGETPEQAAVREIKEETGLNLEVYTGGDMAFRKSYVFAQGISDEAGCTVYGYVSGDISGELQEASERIQAFYVDKAEARRILREEKTTMRAAYLLMTFLNGNEFEFLD